VKKSGKREPRWLAEVLCTALNLPREVYLDPIYGRDKPPKKIARLKARRKGRKPKGLSSGHIE